MATDTKQRQAAKEFVKDWLGELKAYKESGQWRKDFEADEKGEIPEDLKRGILSEDGLFDLLADVTKIMARGKEICGGEGK